MENFIEKELNLKEEDLKNHVKQLQSLTKNEVHFKTYTFLYQNLNILDGKSSALLRLNSILLAGLGGALAFNKGNDAVSLIDYVFIIGILLLGVSSMMCLLVNYIHWSTTADIKDQEAHLTKLLEKREYRTKSLRYAWALIFISLSIILPSIILNFLGVI